MKYRNKGITPTHTLSIHLTKEEKKSIMKLQKKLMKNSDCYISVGEILRKAIIAKISKYNIKNKRVKKKIIKPDRISVTATDKLYKDIKLATQESEYKNESTFMRSAIFEYYNIKS